MSLNDVWRNIDAEIGIYWKGRWDTVPSAPGVYAWFYPLRISTHSLDEFLNDIDKVFTFDAKSNGAQECTLSARFTWEELRLDVRLGPSSPQLPRSITEHWTQLTADPAAFERLRRVVMRGSLLMPPLYVGRTRSLRARCYQHLSGTGDNDFHKRFTTYATTMGLQAKVVNELLFSCVRTSRDSIEAEEDAVEDIVEEILKRACKPRYSVR